jgi:hypothetical protein
MWCAGINLFRYVFLRTQASDADLVSGGRDRGNLRTRCSEFLSSQVGNSSSEHYSLYPNAAPSLTSGVSVTSQV